MKSIKLIIALFILITNILIAQDVLWNPLIRGNIDGARWEKTFVMADLTADEWIFGDTTANGMFVPEQPLEIIDIAIFGDPDSGDSMRVVIYDCAAGTGNSQVAAISDTLVGTTWSMKDDIAINGTLSSTYKIITASEGMAIEYDFIAGTPNKVRVMIIGKYVQKDFLE